MRGLGDLFVVLLELSSGGVVRAGADGVFVCVCVCVCVCVYLLR